MVLWTNKTGGFTSSVIVFLLVFCCAVDANHQPYLTAYACEGTTLSIECTAGTQVNIIRANYGRFSITICNPQGNTEWSVNCQSPRTHAVLVERCSGKSSCAIEVSSDIFGDACPGTVKYIETQYTCGVGQNSCTIDASTRQFGDGCPGTFKYLEAHYQCRSATTTTTTARPRPSWFVEQRPHVWFPPSLNASLPSTILPKALPTSTHPTPTTTSSTTSSSTTTQTPTTIPQQVSKTTTTTTTPQVTPSPPPSPPPQFVRSEVPLIQSTHASIRRKAATPPVGIGGEEASVSWCSPAFARGLYWNWTKCGEWAVISCPGGATGSARRQCVDGEWALPTDLSECRSAWLTNLESRAKGNDAVLGVSTDLAKVTSSKSLYGGDLITSARMIKTLSRRMMQDAAHFPEPQQRQAVVTEFLLASLDTGSALLSSGMAGAWGDLSISQRRTAVTELMIGLEETSFLLASVLPTATQAAHFKSHVLASARAVSADGSAVQFPSNEDKSLNWVFTESVKIPPEAVLENSEGRATRVIFLTFRHLEDLLTPYDEELGDLPRRNVSRIVNSKVVSASLGHGRHIQLPEPVVLTFSLLRLDNVSNPVCAYWDYTSYAWNDQGCTTLHHNRTHVTCQCDHLTNFAVIMDEASAIVVDVSVSGLEVLPYVGCFICIVFLVCSLVMFSVFKTLSSPKTHVHRHVSFCILIAEITFAAGIWRTDVPAACGIVAGILHYSILAAFVWMLIEGLQIYMCACRSLEMELIALRWWHYILAYGGPLIFVCGAAVVDPFSFGTSDHCWLRIDNYFVLSLIGPAIVLMLIQLIFMAIALVRTCRLNPDEALKTKEMSRLHSAKSWLRTTFVLLSMLVLTWVSAMLLVHQRTIGAAVAFCVCNSLYGILSLISHCVREQKVRDWCCRREEASNAWMPDFLRCFFATEKQTYSPNNGPDPTSNEASAHTLTQYLPTICHLGALKGTPAASHLQGGTLLSGPSMTASRGSIRGYGSGSLRIGSLQQSFQQHTPNIMATPPGCPTTLSPPNEEDSYKSFSRDSGHGGSEQEDSPRTPWSNRNNQRYTNPSDLKNNYLERMNTLNKLSDRSSPQMEKPPNNYTLHPQSHMMRSHRANSPWNHTYMEIENGDPVYEDIERERWARREVMQVSDLSDEDKRATPSDASHQSSRSYGDSKPLLPYQSQFSLSEQRLRDFNAAQMSLDLQHLQKVHNLSRENVMTVAVLNGEQVVCRLSSPNGQQNLPIIHESTNGYPAHIVVSRPQYVAANSQC